MFKRAIVLGLVLVLTALPAAGDERDVRDREDVDGPLDIVVASHGHKTTKAGRERFVHTIYAAEPWRARILRSNARRSGSIRILFDTRQNVGYDDYSGVTEREVVIYYQNGKLRATLYNHLGDPPKEIARLRVTRPTQASVRVFVPRRALKKGELDYYEWGVNAYISRRSEPCDQQDPCSDYAPDRKRGYVRHDV